MKWIWNTLTHFLQAEENKLSGTLRRNPVSGGETPSLPAEEKEAAQKDPQNGGKALFSLRLKTLRFGRVVEAEVLLRAEFRQGDSSAVWGQLQGVVPGLGEDYGRGGTW